MDPRPTLLSLRFSWLVLLVLFAAEVSWCFFFFFFFFGLWFVRTVRFLLSAALRGAGGVDYLLAVVFFSF